MSTPVMAQDTNEDPYIWLEAPASPEAMAWVEAHNAVTTKRFEADPLYKTLYDEAYAILSSPDRIPSVSFRKDKLYNFWQDGEHLRGIWRRTTLDSYRTAAPQWETILDIDALGKAEGKSWVYKGVSCLRPEERLCLVALSDGGADATEVREFDLATKSFVEGGFFIPMSQQAYDWVDENHLLVATNWTGKDLTGSGYPYIVKRVTRGQPLANAVEIFRGGKDDVGTFSGVVRDGDGNQVEMLVQATDIFHSNTYVIVDGEPKQLAIPQKSSVNGMVSGRVIVGLDEDWSVGGTTYKAGSVVALDRAAMLADPANLAPTLIWAPGPREAIQSIATTKDRLLLATLDNVSGRITSYEPLPGGAWAAHRLPLPDNMALGISAADDDSNRVLIGAESFLTPDSLYLADAASNAAPETLKTLKTQFSAPGYTVEQHEAASSDGTKIPYFVIRAKDAPMDGTTPTVIYAYGGFSSSETPFYSGTVGKLWLERGGAYVLANIRGGGEFGPAWHEAGLGTKRQIIYDDFTAVAKDVIARGLSSPAYLGMYGGSNGGLLAGVTMVQHPELYSAIGIQVPLLDMIRISKIARGASWQGEYGNADTDPEVRAFWEKTSPYQNLDPNGKYPEPWIFTTTRDDRTGPQHARKFAARMEEYGLPFLFYENTEGGHGSGADVRQSAVMYAQMYTYFAEKLCLK
ncbi:prolyl oligopeptidase family serine peptidase [Croceibacterium salegens]|nr:prolyl oligopeptidase family serine peptidase [Croceibacterium salegens]